MAAVMVLAAFGLMNWRGGLGVTAGDTHLGPGDDGLGPSQLEAALGLIWSGPEGALWGLHDRGASPELLQGTRTWATSASAVSGWRCAGACAGDW